MKKPKNSIRQALPIIGILLTILSLIFIGRQLAPLLSQASTIQFSPKILVSGLSALGILLIGQLLQATIVWQVMKFISGGSDFRSATRAIFRSQIAKYLPGNVFHIGGSIALLKLDGASTKDATLGIGLQNLLLILSGALIGLPHYLELDQPWLISLALAAGAAILLAITPRGYKWLVNRFEIKFLHGVAIGGASPLLAAFGISLVFMLLSSLSVFVLSLGFITNFEAPFPTYVAAFCISWIAGLVVIGSPGGLGVREAVFISVFPGNTGLEEIALLITLHRILWILSDSVVFLLAPKANSPIIAEEDGRAR